MAESGTLRTEGLGTERRGGGLQSRLRSALMARGWTRPPEPRVRFGQPVLPGLSLLGPEQRDAATALVARADALRAGRVTYGGATRELGSKIDWAARGASDAWRAGLHGLDELFALGVAATVTDDPEARRAYVDAALAHVNDWTARGRSAAATAGLAAQARRLVRLVEATAFFAPELRTNTTARRTLLEAAWTDAVGLATALPRQGDHPDTVPAGRALLLAGRFFDGMEARTWVELGTEALWNRLREDVLDDGGHRAHDPGRHAAVLREYLEAVALLVAAHDDVPSWSRKRLKGMADFLARLTHPDGSLALASGVPADAPPPHELLAVAAVLLREPGFAPEGPLPGVWPLLLLGDAGRRAFAGMPRSAPQAVPRALRRTGYYVLPSPSGDLCLVDGVPGFSWELSLDGAPLVVGPGAGLDAAHPLGEYVRSARARNVVVGADGAALPTVGEADVHWTMRDGLLSFVGNVALGGDRRLRRAVVAMPGRFWLVCDVLIGSGTFDGASVVHLHPDTAVHARCAGRPVLHVARPGHPPLALAGTGGALTLTTGVEAPRPQGWHCPEQGVVAPAPTVSLAVTGTLPLAVAWILVPDAEAAPSVSLAHDAFELHARVRLGDAREIALAVVQDEVELTSPRGRGA